MSVSRDSFKQLVIFDRKKEASFDEIISSEECQSCKTPIKGAVACVQRVTNSSGKVAKIMVCFIHPPGLDSVYTKWVDLYRSGTGKAVYDVDLRIPRDDYEALAAAQATNGEIIEKNEWAKGSSERKGVLEHLEFLQERVVGAQRKGSEEWENFTSYRTPAFAEYKENNAPVKKDNNGKVPEDLARHEIPVVEPDDEELDESAFSYKQYAGMLLFGSVTGGLSAKAAGVSGVTLGALSLTIPGWGLGVLAGTAAACLLLLVFHCCCSSTNLLTEENLEPQSFSP